MHLAGTAAAVVTAVLILLVNVAWSRRGGPPALPARIAVRELSIVDAGGNPVGVFTELDGEPMIALGRGDEYMLTLRTFPTRATLTLGDRSRSILLNADGDMPPHSALTLGGNTHGNGAGLVASQGGEPRMFSGIADQVPMVFTNSEGSGTR